jgi:hypothetical protein
LLLLFGTIPVFRTSTIKTSRLFSIFLTLARRGLPLALQNGQRPAQGFDFLFIANLLPLRVVENFQNFFQLAQGFSQRANNIFHLGNGAHQWRTGGPLLVLRTIRLLLFAAELLRARLMLRKLWARFLFLNNRRGWFGSRSRFGHRLNRILLLNVWRWRGLLLRRFRSGCGFGFRWILLANVAARTALSATTARP